LEYSARRILACCKKGNGPTGQIHIAQDTSVLWVGLDGVTPKVRVRHKDLQGIRSKMESGSVYLKKRESLVRGRTGTSKKGLTKKKVVKGGGKTANSPYCAEF